MPTNNEQSLNNYLFKQQQDEALAELKKLYFKGVLSFTTILFVRETYTRNLELEHIKMFPKKQQGKLISLN